MPARTLTAGLTGPDVARSDEYLTVAEVAARLKLSPKTVRKHVTGLSRDEAIYVVARLGFLADSGEIVYHLAVAGTISLAELRHTIADVVLIHETQDPPLKYLLCRANNLGELTATTHALELRPDVSSVDLSLNREMIIGTEFVHRLVQERIANGKKRLTER